ncbi:unnamed protein product [Miscanthus lutarioriparius]|uniref:Uncharacterized protein n=1 Tax=Miscanthus lutarioriparius TaxID=422564 RepID=A0A811RH02_9POAL|nr:unnamed protein product [Miscanthus lutarioriparius]
MGFDRLLHVGECYDFMRVGFMPTHVGPLGYIFCLCADYFVVLSPQSMANAPPRELWICQCPRTFIEFEDVYAQAEYFFVDVIGIVVHVSNIRGRDDVRMRPYRYVVLMNERYHCIIITVKYTHICCHLSEWRRATSELRILAGLHVQMNRKRGLRNRLLVDEARRRRVQEFAKDTVSRLIDLEN